MESKTEEGEAEMNNRVKKHKSDQVVPRRITFPNNSLAYTPPLPFHKNQVGCSVCKVPKHIQETRDQRSICRFFGPNAQLCKIHEGDNEQQEEIKGIWNYEPLR